MKMVSYSCTLILLYQPVIWDFKCKIT